MLRWQSSALTWIGILGLALVVTTGPALAASSWIHVRVDDVDDDSSVNINLPLSLASIATDFLADEASVQIDDSDVPVEELRRVWRELRNGPDGRYVTVEDHDETITISRRGNKVLIKVIEDDDETVSIRLPISVVDALFSSRGNELNLGAALDVLTETADGEIVAIDGHDAQVRIWVDQQP